MKIIIYSVENTSLFYWGSAWYRKYDMQKSQEKTRAQINIKEINNNIDYTTVQSALYNKESYLYDIILVIKKEVSVISAHTGNLMEADVSFEKVICFL